VKEQTAILKELGNYHQNIFMSIINNEHIDYFDDFISNIEAPVLSPTESNALEGQINYHEATSVLYYINNNKCPGSSGFSADF
jgi:hypothetical protein